MSNRTRPSRSWSQIRGALALGALASAAFVSGGCAVAAGAAVGGVILSQEVRNDKSVELVVDRPEREVWPLVKAYMSKSSIDLIEVDESLKTAAGKVYASRATVRVYAFDETRTKVNVAAKRNAFSDVKAAQAISDQLAHELQEL